MFVIKTWHDITVLYAEFYESEFFALPGACPIQDRFFRVDARLCWKAHIGKLGIGFSVHELTCILEELVLVLEAPL